MTVSNQTNRTSVVGNAAIGQEVPFSFPYAATSDITVYSRVTATGVETLLAETTNYTLTAASDTGGTLTTVTAVAATSEIHIIRDTPKTQTLDLEAGGSFSAENIEDALDKNTKLSIENLDSLERTLVFPATDPTSSFADMQNSIDRASKNLTFDSDGKPTASTVVEEGEVTFTDFGTTIAEAADADTARGLLELDTDDDVEFAGVTGTTGTFSDIITKSPWFDVRAYGAGTSEDGSTNAIAIQAAIDAAELVGGCVTGAPGEYEIDTQLTMDAAASIWWPGATIKQEDGADQTFVLKIDVAGNKDISLLIKVDGNKDNNTAIEGIVLNGVKRSHGLINVTALECDTGIVVEGDTEGNTMFLKGLSCGVGVLERTDGGFTPDENILFVSGESNATHYQKDATGGSITSIVHLSCEQASAYAVILEDGFTIINGELRGCQDGGIDLISGSAVFNNPIIFGADVGWALRVTNSDNVRGSINSSNFDGGVWIKECLYGSLRVRAHSTFSKPAIRLGDTGSTTAARFTITPGSYANSTVGPALHLSQTSYCDVHLQQVFAAAGDDIEFETTASYDTLRLNGKQRYTTSIEENSTTDHTIEYYGGPELNNLSYENSLVLYENDELTYRES